MGNGWRALRRRILTPNKSATLLDKRGFNKKSPEAQELLETIGGYFLDGYAYAVEARTVADAEERLEQLPTRFRGFAYEGAGMGYAVLDALPFGHKHHVADFLAGEHGSQHVYIIYVGVGWAMARVPRFTWPKPDSLDPLLRWLVLDGYGFHQAYFKTRKYVHQHYQDPYFPWPGGDAGGYANRAIDQGIGRALWFVGGSDPDVVADLIETFPESRHADLWGGAGLAATYAGGVERSELIRFRDRAGEHRPILAQGSVFAAECRISEGLLVPHTELATEVFCGMTAEAAAAVSLSARPDAPVDGEVPAFETWRQRIASEVVSLGGVST
ncbi:MAG TPA: DUF1702 family protein [Actinophytocola sp.]|uniref:DUF1702 family protein n=1 Tax=Actinophytocola sp. TaxID=1872138 RepID=UPI002DDD1F79|nr:DUF1702 family protein [Actinophytocola sp.]HEV2781529.1 DUF1702 family protein [Actinophytocola sp.]